MPKIDKNRRRGPIGDTSSTLERLASNQLDNGLELAIKGNQVAEDTAELLDFSNASVSFIERKKIYPNPINAPYMEGLNKDTFQSLKESIIEVGLMHNLVVLDDGNGGYRLISGEKRWTSINLMTPEEYRSCFPEGGVLCKVLPHDPNLSKIDEAIMLLSCNVFVYSAGAADPRQVRDLIQLYNKKGYQKKQLVAFLQEKLKSIDKKAVYKLVFEANAIEPLAELSNQSKITRSALQVFGSLEPKDQEAIYQKIIEERIEKVDEDLARQMKNSLKGRNSGKTAASESVAFMKANAAINSITANLEKSSKATKKGMSNLETRLILSQLENIENRTRELREELMSRLNEK